MSRFFKWVGYFLAAIAVLLFLAVSSIYFITESQLNKSYSIPEELLAVPVPDDPVAIERGRHLVTSILLCTNCHGSDLSGQVFDNGTLIGRISIKNLTPGKGGVGSIAGDADWVRAIRYGVGRDGRSLIEMPSQLYYYLNDRDLGAIISYLKSVPPVDKMLPESRVGPLARLFILQSPDLITAQAIDIQSPRPPDVQLGVTVEYGHYLARICTHCHGEDLAGSAQPGAGLNLTPGGDLSAWTEADFFAAMRDGTTPGGKSLNPDLMPWDQLGKMTNEELKAIWRYLGNLPAVADPISQPPSPGISGE